MVLICGDKGSAYEKNRLIIHGNDIADRVSGLCLAYVAA